MREGNGEESASLGAWLRRQREAREIDLHEIAESTKISLRYLRALEQDRLDLLPAPVFTRGFLREYAKVVGLNPDDVVNFYLAAQRDTRGEGGTGRPETEPPASSAPATPGPWGAGLLVAFLGVAGLATVAYLAFYYAQNRGDDRRASHERPEAAATAPAPPVVPPVSEPVAQEPAPNTTPIVEEPSAPLEVVLDFTDECWVELLVDGRQRISELHVQGESLEVAANESVVLTTVGNPAALEVRVNGRPFPLSGDPGRPLHDVRIDLAALGGSTAAPAAAPLVPG